MPDKYRTAIICCDLEGMTIAEAARQVGCPEGTLNARLARGRAMLAKRLTQRGLTVSGVGWHGLVPERGIRRPTAALGNFHSSSRGVVGGRQNAAGRSISAKVAALMEGVLKAMLLTKLKVTIAVVMALNLIGAGVGLVYCQTAGTGQETQAKPPVAQEKPNVPVLADQQPAPKKGSNDPLPAKPHRPSANADVFLLPRELSVHVFFLARLQQLQQRDQCFSLPTASAWCSWSVRSRHPLTGFTPYIFGMQLPEKTFGLCQAGSSFRCIAFSPDGKLLARGENSTEDILFIWIRPRARCIRLSLSEGIVHLHDAATGKELRTFKVQGQGKDAIVDLHSLAFSPDGATLAACEYRGKLPDTQLTPLFHLWEVATGKELRQTRGEKNEL